MLGQPVSMLIPEVIGFKLTGKLKEGITATDLVLTVTQMLRKKGVVGKFVEFYGDGLAELPLADRATLANMAPEYGATCGFFPVDDVTLEYLRLSGRPAETVDLVEAYSKTQGLWRLPGQEPLFSDSLELDMGNVEASLAGPKRPQEAGQQRGRPPGKRRRRWRGGRQCRSGRRGGLSLRRPDPSSEKRCGGDRRHHFLHQHLQPQRDDGRRAVGEKGRGKGAQTPALGQEFTGPGLQGGHRLLRGCRPDPLPR